HTSLSSVPTRRSSDLIYRYDISLAKVACATIIGSLITPHHSPLQSALWAKRRGRHLYFFIKAFVIIFYRTLRRTILTISLFSHRSEEHTSELQSPYDL